MSSPTKPARPPLDYLRWAIVLIGLLLPTLLLIPLGSLWLWQNQLLLPFVLLGLATTVLAFALQRWLLPADVQQRYVSDEAPETGLTPREVEAWQQVQVIARATQPEHIGSREDALAVALKVFAAVAGVLEPGKKDPLLQFTAPEALAATEQVSRRLREFVERAVPLGDRLTIAQMRALYQWRGTVEFAQSAYDLYRMFRFLNPATALTNEVREQLTRRLVSWGKEHVAKQLTERFVEEVGRAAIDLYGGRLLVVPAADKAAGKDAAAIAARGELAPLRILVAGQTSAGKSTLINALTGVQQAAADAGPTTAKATPYRFARTGLPDLTLLDTPGALLADPIEFVQAAEESDLVVLVIAANRADREPERLALASLRAHFASHPDHRAPDILGVMTNVDRLRPFAEWAPPYDLAATMGAKVQSIQAARAAIAADLHLAETQLIPMSLRVDSPFNLAALWQAIESELPEARNTQLIRSVRRDARATDWAKLWTQATGAGQAAIAVLRGRDPL